VGEIPVEAHLLALRRLIDPWIGLGEAEGGRREALGKRLVFLPEATPDSIQAACAEGGITHVHILAHGAEYMEGYDVRYGLALHDTRDPARADVVTGERLATILRATDRTDREGLARPIVVTLASCYSGAGGTVAGLGASVAHALHEAGIPMVVAGQFPISFRGSVLMVEVLYEGLLRGEDPRVSLSDLRRRLHATHPSAHDWSSLVAYASLPPRFEEWLLETRIAQAKQGFDVAMNDVDQLVNRRPTSPAPETAPVATADSQSQGDNAALLDRVWQKIDLATQRLETLLESASEKHALIHGLLASANKRRAEAFMSLSEVLAEERKAKAAREFYESLKRARRHYREAFQADRTSDWGIVQYLSLDIVIGCLDLGTLKQWGLSISSPPETGGDDERATLWSMARELSMDSLRGMDRSRAVWALGNLVELSMIGILVPEVAARYTIPRLKEAALRYAEDFANMVAEGSFEIYSTKRQILRYVRWYGRIAALGEVAGLAREIANKVGETSRLDRKE
jgi:hypothetical protein